MLYIYKLSIWQQRSRLLPRIESEVKILPAVVVHYLAANYNENFNNCRRYIRVSLKSFYFLSSVI